MLTSFLIILIILLYVHSYFSWVLICNEKTYNQRNSLLEYIDKNPEKLELYAEYKNVDYDTHLSYLFWMKNPRVLYPTLGKLI